MGLTKEAIDKRRQEDYLKAIANHKQWLEENDTYDKWLEGMFKMMKMVHEYDEGVNKIVEEENKKGG